MEPAPPWPFSSLDSSNPFTEETALRALAGIVVALSLGFSVKAETWTVEKDGSGDFTVIQDALDAAAPGDSVLVGPGRFEEFRPGESVVDGFDFQSIAWITTTDLTILGSGPELTTIGPDSLVEEVDGLLPGGIYIDGGAEVVVSGFHVENILFPVTIRNPSKLSRCSVYNPTRSVSIAVLAADGVEIRDCEIRAGHGIFTGSQANQLIVENCSFTGVPINDFGIVIGNGSTEAAIRGCTFDDFDVSVQFSLSGTGTVENCHFIRPRIGAIDLSSGAAVLRGCTIDPGARFPLSVNFGLLEVYDTVIGGGTSATILAWGDMLVRGSHILYGGILSVDSRGAVTRTVDLAGNWWGTSDPATIASWISDQNGNVIYEPFLLGPVPTQVESLGSLKALFDGRLPASQN